MKNLLKVFVFIMACSMLPAEAIVLPAGTSITIPGKAPLLLTEPRFLLDRDDMEKATLAMETVPIREKQIFDLNLVIQKRENSLLFERIALPLAGILLDELFHILVKR